jgi:hypothetical protein
MFSFRRKCRTVFQKNVLFCICTTWMSVPFSSTSLLAFGVVSSAHLICSPLWCMTIGHFSCLLAIVSFYCRCPRCFPHPPFLSVLELELRASSLLGRYSTTWAIPPGLFVLVILETRSHFCPGQPGSQASYSMLPTIAGMTGTCNMPSFFLLRWGSHKLFFFAWAGLDYDPSDLSLLGSRGWQAYVTIGWDGILWTFCLGWPQTTILLILAFQVSKITGVSHQCLAGASFN